MTEPSPLVNIRFSVIRNGYDQGQVDALLFDLSTKVTELQGVLIEATKRADDARRDLVALGEQNPSVAALVDELDALPPAPWVAIPPFAKADFSDARRGYTPGEVQYFLGQLAVKLDELQGLVRAAVRRGDIAEATVRGVRAASAAADKIVADAKAEATSIIENAQAVAQAVNAG